ncbi:Protein of unknown function [Bacillus cytotoxicus]|nr:Protein of unknown function [Bacillus cytotoxicus]
MTVDERVSLYGKVKKYTKRKEQFQNEESMERFRVS